MSQQINTRILLKYDTYENWQNSIIELQPGEVAIATAPFPNLPISTDSAYSVLIKVGPGLFKDLPWTSALAADVYNWAKMPELYIEQIGVGNSIIDIEFVITEAHPNGALVITKGDLNAVTAQYLKDDTSELHIIDIATEPAVVTGGSGSYSLEDNTEYRLTNVANVEFLYPDGNFEVWIKIIFTESGSISASFPSGTQYIGNIPVFNNGETWEISIKDGVAICWRAS